MVTRVIAATTGAGGVGTNFGMAMDSDLLILSPELDRIEHTVNFQESIDFVLWRRSILLVGLSSSEIVLLDPNTFQVIESR